MRHLTIAIALVLIVSLPAIAQLDEKVADRFWESTKILEALVNAPDGGIPQDLLRRAECVGVIPGVKRAAFGIGGRYGRGLVVCRKDGGTGPWGAPSTKAQSLPNYLNAISRTNSWLNWKPPRKAATSSKHLESIWMSSAAVRKPSNWRTLLGEKIPQCL